METSPCVATPITFEDAAFTLLYGLADPLTSPIAVHRASSLMSQLACSDSTMFAIVAGTMLRGLGIAARVELTDPVIRFPGYKLGEAPDGDDARWGVWTHDERLGLNRTDWGVPAEVIDPDSMLFMSCVPSSVHGSTTVLVSVAMRSMQETFVALMRLCDEADLTAVGPWHEAMRLVAFMMRRRRRDEPPLFAAIATIATRAYDSPEEADHALIVAIGEAREAWNEN